MIARVVVAVAMVVVVVVVVVVALENMACVAAGLNRVGMGTQHPKHPPTHQS